MVEWEQSECNRKIVEIVKGLEAYRSARHAYDIADVIEENNLKNPDPFVFDKKVAKRVMGEESKALYEAIRKYEEGCL